MDNTALETEKPTTPEDQYRELVDDGVVPSVRQAGHPNFTREDATPGTSRRVVTPNSALEQSGAEEPGSEEINLSPADKGVTHRNIKEILRIIKDKFFGGENTVRLSPGRLISRIKRRKIIDGDNVVNKYDPSQLNIQ